MLLAVAAKVVGQQNFAFRIMADSTWMGVPSST
jgi:hypothetical protein